MCVKMLISKLKKLSDVQNCKTLIVILKKDQSCDKTRLDLRAERT